MEPKSSLIETSSVARVTQPNDSESFMLMHEVSPDDSRYGTPLNGPNLWPDALPGFQHTVRAYDRAMNDFCHRLLPLIARALDLPRDFFRAWFDRPTTFLRLLHYPPQAPDAPVDAYGAAPHTDYGFITILAQDGVGGLESMAERQRLDGSPANPRDVRGQCRGHAGALDQWTVSNRRRTG